jgi:sulfonate transport system ATP-binding protein
VAARTAQLNPSAYAAPEQLAVRHALKAPPTAPAAAGEVPTVRVRGLSRSFEGRVVIESLNLDVAAGEFLALIGRSGSGKSTLLRAIGGLDDQQGDNVSVRGSAAIAFQDARLLPWRRVLANVSMGLRTDDPIRDARSALREVGLSERASDWPATLSGGESQRASLARALVRRPSLLLLDEPFSALDALTRMAMHDLLLRLWAHHHPAVLLVTHDVDEAVELADRVVVLRGGRIAFETLVEAERPRHRDDARIWELRGRLLGELGVEH